MTDLLNSCNNMDTNNTESFILVYLFIWYIYFLHVLSSTCSLLNPLQSCYLSRSLLALLLSRLFVVSMLINPMVSSQCSSYLIYKLHWYVDCSFTCQNFSLDFQNKILLVFAYLVATPLISFVGFPFSSWFINGGILQSWECL